MECERGGEGRLTIGRETERMERRIVLSRSSGVYIAVRSTTEQTFALAFA